MVDIVMPTECGFGEFERSILLKKHGEDSQTRGLGVKKDVTDQTVDIRD